jgi:NADH-quinone oxidoreductase subunit B
MEQETQNPPIPSELKSNIFITTLDKFYNWGRKRSTWPMGFGLACCAFEMIATAAARYDVARFGMELFRASPRQADLMVVAGTVTKKMLPQIVRLYNQIAEPKYVIAMGACAISGGPFKEGYNVVSGIDKFIPVDVYIPGCPPKPESLLQGFLKLFEKMDNQSIRSVPWYQKTTSEGVPVPILGPDVFDWRRLEELKAHSVTALAGEAAPAESVAELTEASSRT